MKVLVDTNVILDVWLAREPFWRDSAKLIGRIEERKVEGYVCPTTITTLHYLGKKVLGEKKARKLLGQLLELFQVGEIRSDEFVFALKSKVKDYEDAVIEAVGVREKVDVIATRDVDDFKNSQVPSLEPSQLI